VVDASYDAERGVAGIGIVHHAGSRAGRNGPVIATYSEAYVGIPPHDIEEFALLRALEIAVSHQATRVKLRSDYNYMRRQLKALHRSASVPPLGADLRSTVLRLAGTFTDVRFGYVARRKNGWAHRLARAAVETQPANKRPDIAWQFSTSAAERPAPVEDGSSNPSLQRTPHGRSPVRCR
jgi:ribonuclease HI